MQNATPETEGPLKDRRSAWHWLNEGFVLKAVFRGLLAGAVVVLVMDFMEIYERSEEELPGNSTQRAPVVMEPPSRRDQVRTYLPRATPKRASSKGPSMPGYAKPPTDAAVGERMAFARGPKGEASAVGRIEVGTAGDFAQFVRTQGGEIKTLYLHSPGGSVRDALQMSKLIRDSGINTVVPDDAYCASSCPIVFVGGKQRTAGTHAWLGVHQVYTSTEAQGDVHMGVAHGQTVSAAVQDHLYAMGVDPRAWLKAMKTPSDQIYVFTPEELSEYKVATRIASR